MRLAQLHEAQTPVKSTDELIESIKRECGDSVALFKRTNKVLLRGEHMSVPAFESDIRTSRKPLQMQRSKHEAIISAHKILDLPLNRGNSIFCTTSDLISGSWGQTYAIFPKDGWKGLIFEKVKTGYVFHKLFDEILPKAKIKIPVYPGAERKVSGYDPEFIATELQELKPKIFSAKDGGEVLRSNYEDILISGPGYYAILNPRGTLDREKTELPRVLSALDIDAHNLGTQWERDKGEHVTLAQWKEQVLKKYPGATFHQDDTYESDWLAKLDNKFVGSGQFYEDTGYSQVFSHPRDTDY